MENQEKLKLIDIQIIATGLFIVSLVVSIFLLHNDKLILLDKKPIFNNQTEYDILVLNRIFALTLALVFLYTSYKVYEIEDDQYEKKYESLQLLASSLIVISAIIVVYVAVKSEEEGDIIDIINPLL